MSKKDKAAIKLVLDLARKYVLARSLNGQGDPRREEYESLLHVGKMLGSKVDPQKSGSMTDVLEAMEKKVQSK